jgi:ankyrin repeat protein
MSFGVGLGDLLAVIKLAKTTIEDCRHAPSDFAEASKISQSLCLLLEGVKTEFENPDSILHKDDRASTDFAIHFKNCENALKPLAALINKHKNLSGPSVRLLDRMRFPKKDYLEYRGNLAFYTARLSEFLQTVGLGSLGRIENKVQAIKDHLPSIMNKLDQMCAEFRILGDRESVLSDHTDDEKFVWKTFRRRLLNEGFTSQDLTQFGPHIFLRLRELSGCGLLDTDGSTSAWTNDVSSIYHMPFRSGGLSSAEIDDRRSKQTIDSEPSAGNLRSKKSTDSVRSLKRRASEPGDLDQNTEPFARPLSRRATVAPLETRTDVQRSSGSSAPSPIRTWRNKNGKAILKGTLSSKTSRNGQPFVLLMGIEREEVLVPRSNLSDADVAYVDSIYEPSSPMRASGPQEETISRSRSPSPRSRPPSTHRRSSSPSSISEAEVVVEIPRRRARPELLVGQRTHIAPKWKYRERGTSLPEPPPSAYRGDLTSDLLPSAAAKGDLSRVKRLLASGHHIECKGPQSYTSTYTDSEGQTHSQRHSFPETTALYRAAYSGHLDIAHYLLKKGADVNARNGYDGRVGDPILFYVIRNGYQWTARLLLEYEARMEAYGPTTALHVACGQPKRAIVRVVLDYGASIDAKDHLNRTPLYLACVGGFVGSVEILLEEGARTNIIAEQGQTALYKSAGKGQEEIVELLLSYGADPARGRGRLGETAMYKAAWYNELDVVEHMIIFEADVNIKNNQRMKAYKDNAEKVVHGVLAGLSQNHAMMNAWGKTPLHAAAFRGHEEMVQMLLDAGADIEATGNDQVTPMYLAAQQKHKGVVQMCLKAGAKLETEKTDPVLALINERNKQKQAPANGLIRMGERDLERIGTADSLVGLVAGMTRSFAMSRRGLRG